MNYILTAEDNNYPNRGGIAALVGIYESEERANFIKEKDLTKFGDTSTFKVEPTEYKVTEPINIKT